MNEKQKDLHRWNNDKITRSEVCRANILRNGDNR